MPTTVRKSLFHWKALILNSWEGTATPKSWRNFSESC